MHRWDVDSYHISNATLTTQSTFVKLRFCVCTGRNDRCSLDFNQIILQVSSMNFFHEQLISKQKHFTAGMCDDDWREGGFRLSIPPALCTKLRSFDCSNFRSSPAVASKFCRCLRMTVPIPARNNVELLDFNVSIKWVNHVLLLNPHFILQTPSGAQSNLKYWQSHKTHYSAFQA